jgi:pimeloyl-ACP methyl ester carboxylesterase
MVLIAPAPDFTSKLMPLSIPPEALAEIRQTGVWLQPSPYGDPNPITLALLEDGARWSILDSPVPITAPVRILQGGEDPDVPWRHALELAQAIKGPDVVFTLIKDGDHRLSRPQDIARLVGELSSLP